MNKTVLFWLIVLSVEVIITLVMVNPSYIQKEFKEEVGIVVKWFGKEKTTKMYHQSLDSYNSLFVESGIIRESYSFFLPKKKEDGYENKGIQKLSKAKFWVFIENRLDAFWSILKAGMFRFELLLICFLHCLPFLIPSLIDGLTQREICKKSEDNASLNMYTVSKTALISALILPPILLIWPMAISPLYVGWWALVLAISAWFMSANVQHRI